MTAPARASVFTDSTIHVTTVIVNHDGLDTRDGMVCELDWSKSLLTVRASGTVSQAELVQGVRDVTADLRYDDVRHVVVDLLDAAVAADGLLDAVEDLLVVMIGASASNPNVRVAVLASDARIVDLVRMLNSAADDLKPALSCFPDRMSVCAWLTDTPCKVFPSVRFRPR